MGWDRQQSGSRPSAKESDLLERFLQSVCLAGSIAPEKHKSDDCTASPHNLVQKECMLPSRLLYRWFCT